MRIDVEEIYKLKKRLREINDLNIEEIEFYESGKKLIYDRKVASDFKLSGLVNVDFITSKSYLKNGEHCHMIKPEGNRKIRRKGEIPKQKGNRKDRHRVGRLK